MAKRLHLKLQIQIAMRVSRSRRASLAKKRGGCIHTELPTGLLRIYDPTMLYILGTLALTLWLEVVDPTSDAAAEEAGAAQSSARPMLRVREPSARVFVKFLLDPALWIATSAVVVSILWARGVPKRLTRRESWSANWFLFNGCGVHFLINGVTMFGFFEPMAPHLARLDRRYAASVAASAVPTAGEGASADAAGLVRTLAGLELFVLAPLCLVAFYGVAHRKAWRQTLAVLTLCAQLLVSVLFVTPELLSGCMNMQPFGVRSDSVLCLDVPVDTFHLTYFWWGQVRALLLLTSCWFDAGEGGVHAQQPG